jgi:dUTP pyrophosphatase
MKIEVKVKSLTETAQLPRSAHSGDAGLDLFADEDAILRAGTWKSIKTGIAIQLPEGAEAQIRPRSGLAARHGITVLNSPGTVDAGYRGEIKVLLVNMGHKRYKIKQGDRIAQMVVSPIAAVTIVPTAELDGSDRAASGFGSTG